jgi:hypothetical protein
MRVILFMPRFEAPILAGTKRQTIRRERKRPISPGDELSLRRWAGMPYRSPQIILGRAECVAVKEVDIWSDGNFLLVNVGGFELSQRKVEAFARDDGFEDAADMHQHWANHNGFPFRGVVIQWEGFEGRAAT